MEYVYDNLDLRGLVERSGAKHVRKKNDRVELEGGVKYLKWSIFFE